jgi:hypothetical protein
MQIVIEISKDFYEWTKEFWENHPGGTEVHSEIDVATLSISKGTPLPENHGRLIDADKLLKHFERGQMRWGEDVAFVINQETPTVLEGTK